MRTSKQIEFYIFVMLLVLISSEPLSAQRQDVNWLEGTWEGEITTDKGSVMSMTLKVKGQSYEVTYSAEGCAGNWSVYDMGSKKAVFVEGVGGYRRNPSCPNGNKVTVEKVSENELKFKSKYYNSLSTFGNGRLRRILSQESVTEPSRSQNQDDKKTIHNAGKLLVEKEKYRVYENAHWANGFQGSTCSGDMMYLVVVYDIAPNESVDMSLDKFFKEIQPATTKLPNCVYNYYVQKSYDKWTSKQYNIDIYLKNSWFEMDKGNRYRVEYQSAADLKGEEIPFMRLTILDHAEVWKKSRWALSDGYGDSYFKEYIRISDQRYVFDGSEVNERANNGNPANWNLLNARKIIADQKSKDEYDNSPAVIKAKQEEAEKARIAGEEAAKKARIASEAKRRAENLAKAADVLRSYKKDAPATYDFSGYANQNVFQSIYTGKFEPFTGGHESREAWVSSSIRSGFGNADARNPFGFLLNLMETTADAADIRERRDALDGMFYAYHLIYKEQCLSNKEMPWDVSALIFYLERNGVKVEDSEVKGNVYLVRKPFLKAFNRAYGNVGSTDNVNPSVPDSLATDFRKFLKTEGCSSATTRSFEINLYLAAEWLSPLQELQPLESLEAPVSPVAAKQSQPEKQPTAAKQPQPVVQKAKPVVKKKQAKSRAPSKPFEGIVIPKKY